MTIQFRDRPLEKGEHSHYYCDKCGEELDIDSVHSHMCGNAKKTFDMFVIGVW
jgi:hypothetical protein